MAGRTFFWVGTVLLASALGVLGYWAWLPDVSELGGRNPMATQYVKLFVRRTLRKGERPAVAMKWVPLERISPYLRASVLIAEDDRFYQHKGVDWHALEEAMDYNLRNRRWARGASTITQQVARNIFLSPSRSLGRKVREVLIARHMERCLGKDRILEIYLNIVEWGKGVFGAEAASQAYFHKAAADLTAEEAVSLAAALPSPYERNPALPPDERMNRLRQVYLERLEKALPRGIKLDSSAQIEDNTGPAPDGADDD
ncbi:MAG: monofunctional biosynthetic peptidoglycan transglycosylase [Elusimicrobia bacterium GWA2_69_24]|nr:MAG: monofunctional biosynthetic peptidoglycan transglycosylase [Elusimicrobia bacterium GWA2_69_24]